MIGYEDADVPTDDEDDDDEPPAKKRKLEDGLIKSSQEDSRKSFNKASGSTTAAFDRKLRVSICGVPCV